MQAVFQSGGNRVLLHPETDAEMLMLGTLGENGVVASVTQQFDGHPSYRKVKSVVVSLEPAPPLPPPIEPGSAS